MIIIYLLNYYYYLFIYLFLFYFILFYLFIFYSYPWQCNDCKLCLKCNEAGDESKLLFCDLCDRGYHTYCLTPKLETLPKGLWVCEQCAGKYINIKL